MDIRRRDKRNVWAGKDAFEQVLGTRSRQIDGGIVFRRSARQSGENRGTLIDQPTPAIASQVSHLIANELPERSARRMTNNQPFDFRNATIQFDDPLADRER